MSLQNSGSSANKELSGAISGADTAAAADDQLNLDRRPAFAVMALFFILGYWHTSVVVATACVVGSVFRNCCTCCRRHDTRDLPMPWRNRSEPTPARLSQQLLRCLPSPWQRIKKSRHQ
ncbi:hypothetical protein [Rhizobium sp. YTU87027]|uniref:hypothetical protein n=1 Tax=Rhizobium sp. YTU87027 TaxID=3417741 RepID=UPI003D6813F2